jgi:hypothetical protein
MLGNVLGNGNVRIDGTSAPKHRSSELGSLVRQPVPRFAFDLLLIRIVAVFVGLGGGHRYGGDAVASREDGPHLELNHYSDWFWLCLWVAHSSSTGFVSPRDKGEVKNAERELVGRSNIARRTRFACVCACGAQGGGVSTTHTRRRTTRKTTTKIPTRFSGFGPFRWNVGGGAGLAFGSFTVV